MRKSILTLVFVLLTALAGGNAFAQSCDDGPSGPHCMFNACWYDYSKGSSCYSTYGNVSEVETCFDAGWSFGTGSNQWAEFTFEVTEEETYLEAHSFIYFNDPTNLNSNVIIISAYVDHPSGPDNFYQLFAHDGTDGDITNCGSRGGNFPASQGDIVTITITVGKGSSSATIEATVPRIMSGI